MDKLIALPIKGESFLLRRGDRTVLVDGGYNSLDLSRALKTHASDLKQIDIVVCTHADRDHAGGLCNLINASGLDVGEFWLPGTWLGSIPELITNPKAAVSGVLSELDRLPEELKHLRMDHEDVSRHFDTMAVEERRANRRERPWIEPAAGGVEKLANTVSWNDLVELTDACRWYEEPSRTYFEYRMSYAGQALEWGRRQVRYRQAKNIINQQVASYWLELLDAAQVIRAIAAQALLSRAHVRWFDYSAFASSRMAKGGNSGFLEPLNSVELPPQPPQMLSYLARLSPANEECLAFLAPPSDNEGLGVVFCGDSPLGDGQKYANSFLAKNPSASDFPVVATAPHHGSEHNQPAYGHLQSWADVRLWVRSGGSIKQPGSTYKTLPPSSRACTHCPQRRLAPREAIVHLGRHSPCFRVSSHDCICV
ncbi:MAG: MBL fold metallo-hydrolase [Pseudomonas sp.]